jgi:hypothetical protein
MPVHHFPLSFPLLGLQSQRRWLAAQLTHFFEEAEEEVVARPRGVIATLFPPVTFFHVPPRHLVSMSVLEAEE